MWQNYGDLFFQDILDFYIINPPTIIGIQLLHVNDRLWKAGLLLKNEQKYTAVYDPRLCKFLQGRIKNEEKINVKDNHTICILILIFFNNRCS